MAHNILTRVAALCDKYGVALSLHYTDASWIVRVGGHETPPHIMLEWALASAEDYITRTFGGTP